LQTPEAVFTTILLGQTTVGNSVSETLTVKLQDTGPLPELSVPVYDIVETPGRKTVLGAGPVLVGAKGPQLSFTTGSDQGTTALHRAGSVPLIILLGQTKVGSSASEIVTVKLQLVGLAEIS